MSILTDKSSVGAGIAVDEYGMEELHRRTLVAPTSLGSGRVDPFRTYAWDQWDPQMPILIDHCEDYHSPTSCLFC